MPILSWGVGKIIKYDRLSTNNVKCQGENHVIWVLRCIKSCEWTTSEGNY